MKTRIVLSAVSAFLSVFALKAFHFFYSPITGVATAQSVNDDVGSFAMAKFIRDGGVESSMFYIFMFILFCIWVGPVYTLVTGGKKTVGK